jgi:50S ribosomal protein L16 3-hydroxylase
MPRPKPSVPIETQARPGQPLGMPAARFLRDYWQKRPLLVRAAFPGFAPLTPEDLAGLACEEAALSRLVRHERASDGWSVRHGPFAEADFPSLPRQDWTLLVQDVDKWDGDVAALLSAFEFLPRWRIDDVMVSFAAPGGSVGAHVDQYDVFLVQGLGRRRWQIDARPDPSVAFRDDVELKLLKHFAPSHDWVLSPGDMLYLPPGVPHHGVALDACLTYSVGMRAPSQAELLVDFAEYLAEALPESQRLADPDLMPARSDGEIDDAALARVAEALPWFRAAGEVPTESPRAPASDRGRGQAPEQDQERAGETASCSGEVGVTSLRTWFGRFITRYRSAGEIAAPPRAPTVVQIEKGLAAGALLHRHPFSRSAWARAGRQAELYVDGEAFPCSLATARRLGGRAPLDADAWQALDAPGRALLHHLCLRGCFALSRPPRRRAP